MARKLPLIVALMFVSLLAFAQLCGCYLCTCGAGQCANGQCARHAVSNAAPPLPPPPCATKLQSSMLCTAPQVYGTGGLILPNPNHAAHFASSEANFQIPLSVSVGTELSLLSIPSPASGVLFTYDQTLHTYVPSQESYGPIVTERAETIGKHRIFVATTYQFFDFSSLDGIDLKHLPVVYSHVEFPVGGQIPAFEHEFITTQNRIDLKAHQTTLVGTFGLTNRIDVSVAVPILDVRLGITSNATIVRTSPQPVAPNDPLFGSTVDGFYHFFNVNNPAGSVNQTFSNFKSAFGIGDVVFRIKGTVLKAERFRVALGLDVRTPTGDAENFLGSGTPGYKPFIAASYAGRISPHANLGFQYNGQSVLAGNLGTATSGKLPNEFFYSGGVDIAVKRRLTLAADLVGTRLSSATRIRQSAFVDIDGVSHPDIPTTTLFRDPVNMIDISTGVKYKPWGNLLLTANVAFKANDPGLRAKVIPLGGISYSF